MQNHNSLKYLHIINKPYNSSQLRFRTPTRNEYPSIKEKLLESRKWSPESRLKLKNTMATYKSIKRSLSPIKSPHLQPQESLKLFHKPKSLPFQKAEITKISVKEYGIGNEYALALSSTVKELPNLKELNIRHNRIQDDGTFSLLSSINKTNMKVLDLSDNIIGFSSINAVTEIISDFNSGIEKLSLESTRLTFNSVVKVFSGLRSNHSLQELNLANNKLGSGCGAYLKEFLSQTTTLKKMDLHWNYLNGPEAVQLFEGLKLNDTLEALDCSWNSFGSSTEAIEALCKFLLSESQLQHLDISNNRISFESSELIANAIKDNHTLLGLHVEGNYCRINHLGFVFPCRQIGISPSLQKSARILRTPRRVNDTRCWICNKYFDLQFTWDPDNILWKKSLKSIFSFKSGQNRELVYLHLEIDDFEPFQMNSKNSNCYTLIRAVPSNKQINFFFSYRGQAQISFDYPTETVQSFVKTVGSQEILVKALNSFKLFEGVLSCKPRILSAPYLLENEEESFINSDWSFEKSQFSNFVWDSENILNECFEFDWSHSKMQRLIKSEELRNDIKEAVKPYYKKKTYKFYSALGTNGSIFSINLAILTELCQKTEIIDKNFKISDIDLALKASKFSLSSINTSYGLVRHEFLEFVIRVAIDKYHRSGVCKLETEAIHNFFSTNFLKFPIYDQDKWRWERFFTQECEEVLIDNRDILQAVFDLNSGKKAKPGEKKFMQIEDFVTVCQTHELMSEVFNLRHATLCYHMSLMTHIDELNGITHTQANKLEFTEALARVVDYFDSPNPEPDIINDVYQKIPLETKLKSVFANSFSKYKVPRKLRNLN